MILKNLNIEEYHTQPELSSSGIKALLTCPRFYKEGIWTETKSMSLGTAVHSATLEPEVFKASYILGPDAHKNSDVWKDFVKENPGKICLKPAEMENTLVVADSLRNDEDSKHIFRAGEAENSVFGEIEGTPARCRVDWMTNTSIPFDLKSIGSKISMRSIEKAINNYGYHISVAWYTDLLTAEGSYNINSPMQLVFVNPKPVYKTVPKHDIAVIQLSKDKIEEGREEYRKALRIYKQYMEAKIWPKTLPGLNNVVGTWAERRAEYV